MIEWIFDQAKLPPVGTEVLLTCQWQKTDRLVVVLARQAQFDPARKRGLRRLAKGSEPYLGWQSTWDGSELDADLHPICFAVLTEPNWRERRK